MPSIKQLFAQTSHRNICAMIILCLGLVGWGSGHAVEAKENRYTKAHTQTQKENNGFTSNHMPSYPTPQKDSHAQNPGKKKVLVAIFGMLSRSIRDTWPQIQKNIITPLSQDYHVSIYVLNNLVDNTPTLDGMPIRPVDKSTLPIPGPIHAYDIQQSKLDTILANSFSPIGNYLPRFYKDGDPRKHNALRQFVQEQLVANYLKQNQDQYDTVVAICTDVYPLLPINLEDIAQSSQQDLTLYTSIQSDCSGVTNGFYIGTPSTVAKAMSTLDNTQQQPNYGFNYETALADNIRNQKILRKITPMPFCKMRNDHTCDFKSAGNKSKAIKKLGPKNKKKATEALKAVTLQH